MGAFDDLRKGLGPEFDYGFGDWFRLRHDEIVKVSDRSRFAEKFNRRGKRPVVLFKRDGPDPILFARSASGRSGLKHPAHIHPDRPCKIDKDGRIVYRVPVTVPAGAICEANWSCHEEDEDWLRSELTRLLGS